MKKFLLSLACLSLVATAAFSQNTATFSFNDGSGVVTSGTYNQNGTFTVDLLGTFNFTAIGFSVWLEAPTTSGFASSLLITNVAYVKFTDPTDNGFPKNFSDTAGRSAANYLTDADTVINPQTGTIDQGDLGATSPVATAGTYTLLTITFSLTNAPPGTYVINTTNVSPRQSEITESGTFVSVNAPQASYTITVVPEPATWSLLGLGGLGSVGMTMLRRRRSA